MSLEDVMKIKPLRKIFFCALCFAAAAFCFALGFAQDEEPTDAIGLAKLGVKYFQERDYDRSIEYGEKALAVVKDDNLKAGIYFNLSSAYLEKGIVPYLTKKEDRFYKKALIYANACVKMKPEHWRALGTIATIYMNMGKVDLADSYFEQAEKYANVDSPYYQHLLIQHSAVKRALEAQRKRESLKNKGGSK